MSDLLRKLPVYREELDSDAMADYSFIIGDFNYRMNSTFTELVPQMEKILELRPKLDQLHIAMNFQNKYPGYFEAPIAFLPTYKRHATNPRQFHNKKNQAPSYTDRVLIRNN
mmetsp:Transcript_26318/g.19746  ORF Transcript_26318/g.19746 Transcript_26318/m.19746 type:complete len:112 (+) Transcript_26318:102-437(+)